MTIQLQLNPESTLWVKGKAVGFSSQYYLQII